MNAQRFLAVLALMALATACSSQPQGRGGGGRGGPGGPGGFASLPSLYAPPLSLLYVGMDQDGDGLTARAEAESWSGAAFLKADEDGDGALRPLEFASFAKIYLGTDDAAIGTNSFDRNADGLISPLEFEGYLLHRFGRLDQNQDGVLQRSELLQSMGQPRGQAGQEPRLQGAQRGGGGRRR